MKKIALLLALAVAAIACDNTPEIVPEIKCDVTEIQIPVTIDENTEDVTVAFTTNFAWTATVNGAEGWLVITPTKGEAGDAKITFVAESNTGFDPRTATLVIDASSAHLEIPVVQGQVDAFELIENSAKVGPEGGNVEIKANTNMDWTVEIPADVTWVRLADTKAYGEKAITLTVDAYEEYDVTREAKLAVTAGGEPVVFTVTQVGPTNTLWSVNMTEVAFPRVGSFELVGQTVPTNVSMALFNGDVVVCAGDGTDPVILDKATGAKKGVLNVGKEKPGYITNDDAGNLVFCNRVWNYWTDYKFFTVYYMKPGDTEPTKLVSTADEEYYPSYLGAGLSVKGDVTKKAAIAAPWEGVAVATGENMVLCWQVTDGKAGNYVKGTLTGFVGIGWMAGYWCQSPNNYPGFTLVSDDLADGGFVTVYDENKLYKVNADFSCTLVADEQVIDGNNIANAMYVFSDGTKSYLAVSGGVYFSNYGISPVVKIFSSSDNALVAECHTNTFCTEEGNGFCSAAVRMEKTAENGLVAYHINNACSVIEAIRVRVE